jgi:predicted ArsR family transcriptional regulator
MTGHASQDPEVDGFILEEIESVPHLEALLLLWSSRPRTWTAAEMAQALYVSETAARAILQGLGRRQLCATPRGPVECWRYDGGSGGRDELVGRVEDAYRRELVRISRMIHAKGTPGMRGFAEAFRFKKDRE